MTITGARDGLTIRAVEPWTAVIRTPRDLTASPSSLIMIDGVDRLRVQWLRLAIRTAEPCDRLHYGVFVLDAHDAQVRSLRIEPLGPDTVGHCGYRYGIAVHRGASTFVGYNLIRDFTDTGIQIIGARTTATVFHNSIRYLHPAEAPDECCAIGIEAYSEPLVTIRGNAIRSGPGPGWPTPVLVAGMSLELRDGSVVAGNRVHRAFDDIATWFNGIPQPRAIVRGNVITGGPPDDSVGLSIEDASTYSDNWVSGYGIGAWVDEGYSPTLRGNDFRGNDSLDCLDSGGTGSDGALSTWIDNLGNTSEPPGICSPAP